MKKRTVTKSLQWGLLVLFLMIIVLSLVNPNLSSLPIKQPQDPDFEFETIKISHLEKGQLKWSLSAQKAQVFKASQKTYLIGVHGYIYPQGQSSIFIQAQSAHLNFDQSIVSLHQASFSSNIQKKTLSIHSPLLIWNSQKQTFQSTSNVVVKAGGYTLSGQELFASLPLQKVYIKRNARAVFE